MLDEWVKGAINVGDYNKYNRVFNGPRAVLFARLQPRLQQLASDGELIILGDDQVMLEQPL